MFKKFCPVFNVNYGGGTYTQINTIFGDFRKTEMKRCQYI